MGPSDLPASMNDYSAGLRRVLGRNGSRLPAEVVRVPGGIMVLDSFVGSDEWVIANDPSAAPMLRAAATCGRLAGVALSAEDAELADLATFCDKVPAGRPAAQDHTRS